MLMITWSSSMISSTVQIFRGDPRIDSIVNSFSYQSSPPTTATSGRPSTFFASDLLRTYSVSICRKS